MKNTTKIALAFSGLVVLIVAGFIISALVQAQSRQDAMRDPSTGLVSAEREDSHRLSAPTNPSVTVVEFLDFECAACAAAFPVVEQLREEYGEQVSFAVRYFPLNSHPNAQTAAVAVEAAARQGQFEEMYKRIFETQPQWAGNGNSQAPFFRDLAESLSLDMDQFDRDVADPETLARVMSDFDDGLAIGVSGTPSFFVNDQKVDLRSFDDLGAAIDKALAGE